ncbi:uncharacterized protein LOC125496667 [Beta vulgaris subsp. vulgaris]|uniref:uncharacterized protein LOC125496667 n=1 Tax=Beta vulgaris subsp. vulgaris TaxID=3555 RepID=UPI0020366F92|nr:uncharacterized protein LOC125496667 [Beta vulgaris subsp. vulgaris]
MEYLSRKLGALKENPNFNYHPRCEKLSITHLMFADDLLLFARADMSSVDLMFQAFKEFSAASGLAANLDKSNVYFAGINDDEKDRLQQILHIPVGNFPFKYLGVPLQVRKLFYSECKPLIAKVVARIQLWTAKKLSYAGRSQLISSVLQGIQLYWSQIFLLPKKVLREIQSILRSFLWSGTSDSRKALVAWDDLCYKKTSGGLNFKESITWNTAAIGKFFWALAQKQDRLWIKWLHAYYIKRRDVWSMEIPKRLSWALKKILEARNHLENPMQCLQFEHDGKFSIKSSIGF